MPATFVNAGALGSSATVTPIAIAAPTLEADDLMICFLINKELGVTISAPDSTWTELYQADGDCTTAADDHRAAIFWRWAAASDSAASFNFAKSADNNILFMGVIGVWRGCYRVVGRTPIDSTAVAAQVNAAAADAVTFPAFDPTTAGAHIIFAAFYGNDLTTFAAAMSADVNPDCTTRIDLESSLGNDASIAVTSGNSDGSNIASRTWASASTTDAGSTAVVFGLVPTPSFRLNNYQSVKTRGDGMSVTEHFR